MRPLREPAADYRADHAGEWVEETDEAPTRWDPVISRELAAALEAAGVLWTPAVGDRFTLHNPAFDGEVFTLSDMTIETQGTADARVLGFNGTTEWALDSVELREALWLPREDQLRELLGAAFLSLEYAAGGFTVTLADSIDPAGSGRYSGTEAADAYARALLARLDGPRPDDPRLDARTAERR